VFEEEDGREVPAFDFETKIEDDELIKKEN